MSKMLIARIDAFTKNGRYVPRGQTVSSDEVDYSKADKNSAFIPAPSGVNANAVVEMSAIAPTGPNPKNPQQLPNGAVQTAEGYVQAGATLIGEITLPEQERRVMIVEDDETQSLIADALEKAKAAA